MVLVMRQFFLFLLIALCPAVVLGKPIPAEKVLFVRVNETGLIMVGRDTVGADQLARYIQERLFKSYMGTGQMHDRIRLEKADDSAPEDVMDVVTTEIKEGQRKALQELCLEKFRRTFEMLDIKKQTKLKKQFPVLFQTHYLQAPAV